MLHEQQICKSYTVQIDCEAHTTDSGVLGHPLSPSDLKSKSRHAELQDTHGLSGKKKNLHVEILREINRREDEELMLE